MPSKETTSADGEEFTRYQEEKTSILTSILSRAGPLMQHQGQRKMHGNTLNVGNQRASEFVLN